MLKDLDLVVDQSFPLSQDPTSQEEEIKNPQEENRVKAPLIHSSLPIISLKEKEESVIATTEQETLFSVTSSEDHKIDEDPQKEEESVNEVEEIERSESEECFFDSFSHQQKMWNHFVELALKNDQASQLRALEVSMAFDQDLIKKIVPSLFSTYEFLTKTSFAESRGWKLIQSRIGKSDRCSLVIVETAFDYLLIKNKPFSLLLLAKALIGQNNEMCRALVKQAFEYFREMNNPKYVIKLAQQCVKMGKEIDLDILQAVFDDFIDKKKFDLALKLALSCVDKEEARLQLVEKAFNTFIAVKAFDQALGIALAYVGKNGEVNERILELVFDEFMKIKAFKQALKLALACLEYDEGVSPLIAIHAYFEFYEQDLESMLELVEACRKQNNDASQYILFWDGTRSTNKNNRLEGIDILQIC